MTPEISQEYYIYIQSLINDKTSIPTGYDIPDYYFIKQIIVVDNSKNRAYRPFVILKFGDNYRDDVYKTLIVTPEFKHFSVGE